MLLRPASAENMFNKVDVQALLEIAVATMAVKVLRRAVIMLLYWVMLRWAVSKPRCLYQT